MIGCSPAVFALASRSSNSSTVFGGVGHADLRRELLVVEDAGQAVVQASRVERSGPALPVAGDAVLDELGRRELVPAVRGHVLIEVLEQTVLDQRDHRRQPDQVRRVVARQQARRCGHEVRELVLLDVPGDVRVLLGELLGQLERDVEAGLEVGAQLDRIGSAVRASAAALADGDSRRRRWRLRAGASRPPSVTASRPRRGAGGDEARREGQTASRAAHAVARLRVKSMLIMNPPVRSCHDGYGRWLGPSSTALLRRRRGRPDHELWFQPGQRAAARTGP